jgi:hypothetical protein
MTHERDIERLLDTWFRDGPYEAPDRVIDAVADQIGRVHQRPAWRLDWRHIHMTTTFKLASAIAAVAIIAILSSQFLPGSPGSDGVGGPGATPSASPSPSPSASPTPSSVSCEDDLPGCAGPLAEGAHRSNQLVPAISYETPFGWNNAIDLPGIYKLDPPGVGSPYIIVWTDASITDQTTTCSLDPDPNLGRSAADWIAFLTTHPGLEASQPVDVDFGGVTGQQVELALASDWTTTCPNHNGPYAVLLTQRIEGRDSEYGMPWDQRLLMTVVDVDGKTVVIQSYGPQSATAFASSTAAVRQVIASFRFD